MERNILYIENNGRCEQVPLANLLYITSSATETYFFTTAGVVVSPVPLYMFDQFLSRGKFCRIHPAHLISLEKIISFDSATVLMPGALLPLAGEYLALLRERVRILESMEAPDATGNLIVDANGRLISNT